VEVVVKNCYRVATIIFAATISVVEGGF